MMRSGYGWLWLAGLVAGAFALRTLQLIDATALWSDELYSVGKSFQASPAELLKMLRQDTHPPFYYGLLWCWGQLVGQSPVSLRLLSWLAYVSGGIVMVLQARALCTDRRMVMPLAVLFAFCSPYPVRFAIEGKSYALLVLLVALAWWWRRKESSIFYGIAVALAGLTHFYGLFLTLAAAAWDGWQRRRRLMAAALLGAMPALLWIVYAAGYLFSPRAGSWIGAPEFALLEDTLARALGLWPLPKLLLLVLSFLMLRRWGGLEPVAWRDRRLLDRSGLIPSVLMVLVVVAVSFVKPLAFSRYFVVLLPAAVSTLAVLFGRFNLNRNGRRCVAVVLTLMLTSWWGTGFAELASGSGGVREQDQFRLISQRAEGLTERFSPRSRLLNLSDRMELSMGRISPPAVPWMDHDALQKRLQIIPRPEKLWLASSGPPPALEGKLRPFLQLMEQAGYQCLDHSADLTHGRLLQCRSTSRVPAP